MQIICSSDESEREKSDIEEEKGKNTTFAVERDNDVIVNCRIKHEPINCCFLYDENIGR